MSELKTFMVCSEDNQFLVVLEVDLAKLTAERATQINTFWSGDDDRLHAEEVDVVRAVIRLFGARLIGMLLQSDGVHFDHRTDPDRAEYWTEEMHILEGWGDEDGTPHGWCGIRALSAEVVAPGFDEVELHEVIMAAVAAK